MIFIGKTKVLKKDVFIPMEIGSWLFNFIKLNMLFIISKMDEHIFISTTVYFSLPLGSGKRKIRISISNFSFFHRQKKKQTPFFKGIKKRTSIVMSLFYNSNKRFTVLQLLILFHYHLCLVILPRQIPFL